VLSGSCKEPSISAITIPIRGVTVTAVRAHTSAVLTLEEAASYLKLGAEELL
jgi:hypothetical protein